MNHATNIAHLIDTAPKGKGAPVIYCNDGRPIYLGRARGYAKVDDLLVATGFSATYLSHAAVLGRSCYLAHANSQPSSLA